MVSHTPVGSAASRPGLTGSEPAWLDERRRKGASLAESLDLPHPKAKGWEFTDLSNLDLDAYRRGRWRRRRLGRERRAHPPRSRRLRLPSPGRLADPRLRTPRALGQRQALRADRDASRRRGRPLPRACRRAPRLGRSLRRHLRRPQRGLVVRRRVRLRPRRPALRDADRPLRDPGRSRLGHGLALADRPRGGRGSRGMGAVPRRRPRGGGALQRCHRDPRRPGRDASLRLRPGPLRLLMGLRDPARRGRARRVARLAGAGLRLGARQGAHGDEARGPGLLGQGHRRLRGPRAPSTSTTTRHRSTQLPTPSPTSPSAESSRTRPPQSGAG